MDNPTPEVNLKECTSCMPAPSANKAAHSDFKNPEETSAE